MLCLVLPCLAVPRRGKKGQEGARRGKKGQEEGKGCLGYALVFKESAPCFNKVEATKCSKTFKLAPEQGSCLHLNRVCAKTKFVLACKNCAQKACAQFLQPELCSGETKFRHRTKFVQKRCKNGACLQKRSWCLQKLRFCTNFVFASTSFAYVCTNCAQTVLPVPERSSGKNFVQVQGLCKVCANKHRFCKVWYISEAYASKVFASTGCKVASEQSSGSTNF